MPDLLKSRWRTGRKVGRTIYAVVGDEPSDDDVLIGVMDTRELAATAVVGHNFALSVGRGDPVARERPTDSYRDRGMEHPRRDSMG